MKKLSCILISLLLLFTLAVPCFAEYESTIKFDWFEDEFFNGATEGDEENYRITNRFLLSKYERPEDIDLYSLFYEEFSPASDEEVKALSENKDYDPNVNTFKLSKSEMDEILEKYTGLKVDDTAKVGLDKMYYLDKYDCFYTNENLNETDRDPKVRLSHLNIITDKTKATIKYYAEDLAGQEITGEVVLKYISETEYHFISNTFWETVSVDHPDDYMPEFKIRSWEDFKAAYGGLAEELIVAAVVIVALIVVAVVIISKKRKNKKSDS